MTTQDGRASDSCCQIAHRMGGYWAVDGRVALGGGVHGLLFCGLRCLARHVPLVRGSDALDKASYMAMPSLSVAVVLSRHHRCLVPSQLRTHRLYNSVFLIETPDLGIAEQWLMHLQDPDSWLDVAFEHGELVVTVE